MLLDLSGTLPSPVELVLDPDASEDLHSVFDAYWSAREWAETGGTRWAEPVSAIDGGRWGTETAIAAGAGGVATVPGLSCAVCGRGLTLTSRTNFDRTQRGAPCRCRDCTARFNDRVAKLSSLQASSRRAADAARRDAAARAETVRQQLHQRRRDAVLERYGHPRGAAAPEVDRVELAQLITALALLRHHTRDGLVLPLTDAEIPLAPDTTIDRISAVTGGGGLLAVHPSSSEDTFIWQADAGDDGALFANRWYPLRARLYRDVGSDLPVAAARLERDVVDMLDVSSMDSGEQEGLLLLARDIVAEEGARYLDYQLSRYNLPGIPAQHRARLTAVMQRAADHFALGSIYQQAWSAASAATNLIQSVRTTREKASTYALNRFEKRLSELVEHPETALEPYHLIDQVPLSSIARTIFWDVLRRDIVTVDVQSIRQGLPTPIDVRGRARCFEVLPTVTAADRDAVLDSLPVFGVERLREVLLADDEECAPGCSHALANLSSRPVLRQLDALAARIGEMPAAIAVVTALPWLDHTHDANPNARPGSALVERIRGAQQNPQ